MKKHTNRKVWGLGHLLLPKQRDDIVLPAHIALNAMETGAGELIHRHTIAAFLNITGFCAARMVGTSSETREAIDAAKYALVDADRRYLRTNKWGFTGPEMLLIRHAVTLADHLLKRANSQMLTNAVAFVSKCNEEAAPTGTLGTCSMPLQMVAA